MKAKEEYHTVTSVKYFNVIISYAACILGDLSALNQLQMLLNIY